MIEKRIIFWGATGMAKVYYDFIGSLGYRLVLLVDNNPSVRSPISHVPLVYGEAGFEEWLADNQLSSPLYFAVSVGGNHGDARESISVFLKRRQLISCTLLHPKAWVSPSAEIGDGSVILANVTVCANTEIGRNVILNTASVIEHDCRVGDGVHVAGGTIIAGEVSIGNNAFIGIGARILPRISVGENAIVGAGAVVTRDVPANTTVVGIPAKLAGPR